MFEKVPETLEMLRSRGRFAIFGMEISLTWAQRQAISLRYEQQHKVARRLQEEV